MVPIDSRLFHLHYHVPDVEYAEQVLAEKGLPLRAKFGVVDGESIAVKPGESPPNGFQFRLQDAQRGYANVTLTRGNRVQFDHFGVVTSEFEEVIDRASDAGWTVQGHNDRRTFLITPWRFRIEVHPAAGRIEKSLGARDEGRFEAFVLSVPTPSEVSEELQYVLGELSELSVQKVEGRPDIPQATMVGEAFPNGVTIQAASLAA